MENFEEENSTIDFFCKVEELFSDENEKNVSNDSEGLITEIYIENEELPTHSMVANLKNVFQNELMNEHLGTVELLGDLGYTDVLWYYCMVMDLVAINKEFDEKRLDEKVQTPDQYIENLKNNEKIKFSIDVTCRETETAKIKNLISYLKNKEFTILTNTFYSDGADFIISLVMRSTVGYNLRLKLTVKCKDERDAEELKIRFEKELNQL